MKMLHFNYFVSAVARSNRTSTIASFLPAFFVIAIFISICFAIYFFHVRGKTKAEIKNLIKEIDDLKIYIQNGSSDSNELSKIVESFNRSLADANYWAERERILCNLMGGRGDASALFYYKDSSKISNLSREFTLQLRNFHDNIRNNA